MRWSVLSSRLRRMRSRRWVRGKLAPRFSRRGAADVGGILRTDARPNGMVHIQVDYLVDTRPTLVVYPQAVDDVLVRDVGQWVRQLASTSGGRFQELD